MLWENLTSKQHAALARSLPVVLPIASVEQHGPALPVCVDSLIGWRLCEELEQRRSKDFLLLPQIKICYSEHHMDFAGSLTATHESLLAYLADILASVVRQGYEKILLYNSHGGNQGLMQVLLEKLGNQHKDTDIFATSWWKLCQNELREIQESGFMGNGHAAEFEFSLVEYLRPDLVDYASKDSGSIAQVPLPQARGDLVQGGTVAHLQTFWEQTQNGTYGLTEKASAAKGERIFLAAASSFEALLDEICRLEPRLERRKKKQ